MQTKNFIIAGKAIFTVDNGKGDHYTFRINKKEASGSYPEAFFVALLSGPDNTSDYSYLGMLVPQTGEVRLTAKSRYKEDTVPVKVIRWALKKVWTDQEFPQGYAIYHEGRCGRCGRLLTVPSSVESGFGPECASVLGIDQDSSPKPQEAPKEAPQAPKEPETISGFISDRALSTKGLSPIRDEEGEVSHWEGMRDGRKIIVFND